MGAGFGPWGRRAAVPRGDDARNAPPRTAGHYACESCGAILAFEPGTQELVCAYCGHRNRIAERPVEVVENDLDEGLRAFGEEALDDAPVATKCGSCGADFELPLAMHAGLCPFCGQPHVADPGARRRVRPHGVLPFLVGEPEARARLNDWLASLWFAPSRLKEQARGPSRLEGLYVPHWTFDASTTTDYVGRRGDVYYETRFVWATVNGRRVRQAVQVPKIRWRPARGRVARHFDDVLVVAGEHVPPPLVAALEPWDLDAVKPYTPDYLSGFESELYRRALPDSFARAKEIMQQTIAADVRRDIGGDQQVIERMAVAYRDPTFKLVLLPLWAAEFHFLGRSYPFLVNGRTGEVHGRRPWSAVKIGAAVLLALLALLLLWLLLGGLDQAFGATRGVL